ncbi:MAG: hypothetical protein LJE87_08275 [Deltaproteobacteria bacterium]|nr:hypothetical protein [Deltaproteobacteria bacterium]
MAKTMAQILKRLAIRSVSHGGVTRALLPFLIPLLMVSCGTQSSEEKGAEVRFREMTVESGAVSKILPLVSPSHVPPERHLTLAQQFLFTYLAQSNPADLVVTRPHSQGDWRIEKVFLLDDCVAVQMTEGHYLETLFFVQYRDGWRLKSRIIPEDHL